MIIYFWKEGPIFKIYLLAQIEVNDIEFFYSILDTSAKELNIHISEIYPEKKEKIFFCQNLIYEIFWSLLHRLYF